MALSMYSSWTDNIALMLWIAGTVPITVSVAASRSTRAAFKLLSERISLKLLLIRSAASQSAWLFVKGKASSWSSSSSRALWTELASGPTTIILPVFPSTLMLLTPVPFSISLMRPPPLPITKPITGMGTKKSTIMPLATSPCAENSSVCVLANFASADMIFM